MKARPDRHVEPRGNCYLGNDGPSLNQRAPKISFRENSPASLITPREPPPRRSHAPTPNKQQTMPRASRRRRRYAKTSVRDRSEIKRLATYHKYAGPRANYARVCSGGAFLTLCDAEMEKREGKNSRGGGVQRKVKNKGELPAGEKAKLIQIHQ